MTTIGRYQVIGELGRGAMGIVYHAVDPAIGRPVAIKTIRLGEFSSPQERETLHDRFFREARSAGILSHPGIVTVYDVDEGDQLAYITMEFVNGPTLERVLGSGEALEPERVLTILREAAAALDYAHRKGIVHRDVKPANIMIAESGAVKITDFGIAKVSKSEQLTQTGAILGTPNYMSPEQVRGLPVDGRSDQFSLAVIAYEMLTGERPFAGEHLTATFYKIVHEEPVPCDRLNRSLNGRIDNALRKALAKKPEERYATCTAFVNALEKVCSAAKGLSIVPRGQNASMPTVATGGEAAPTVAIAPPPARRAAKWIWVAAALAAAAAGAGFVAWNQGWLGPSAGSVLPTAQVHLPPSVETAPPAPSKRPSPLGAAVPPAPAPEAPASTQPQQEPPAPPPADSAAAPAERTEPVPAPPKPRPPAARARPGEPREVVVATRPPGARVVLDERAETACTTPCSVMASPGAHVLTITLEGYELVKRQIEIGEGPFEMSPVALRSLGGVLMLSSQPAGAAIYVDGRRIQDTTPAQLRLPPGRYNIAVQKDGVRRSEEVEIKDEIKQLRIVLQ